MSLHGLSAHDPPGGGAPLDYQAATLFYAPGLDPFLEELAKNADRVWYFDEGPRASPKLISKEYPKAEKSQTTLGAFS